MGSRTFVIPVLEKKKKEIFRREGKGKGVVKGGRRREKKGKRKEGEGKKGERKKVLEGN